MRQRQNSGFTLVEVIAAFVILGIAGGVILNSFAMAIRLNVKAEQAFKAANDARMSLEYVLHLDQIKENVSTWAVGQKADNSDALLSYVSSDWQEIEALKQGIVLPSGERELLEGLDTDIGIASVSVGSYKSASEDHPETIDCRVQLTVKAEDGEEEIWTGFCRIILPGESEAEGE